MESSSGNVLAKLVDARRTLVDATALAEDLVREAEGIMRAVADGSAERDPSLVRMMASQWVERYEGVSDGND